MYEWEGRGWVQGYWGGEGDERGNLPDDLVRSGIHHGLVASSPSPALLAAASELKRTSPSDG